MERAVSKQYVLAILTVILTFNYVDRWALGIVLQDIKADLHLTDTQLGLMTGLGFALFYAVMGVPIARWADRGNRTVIITLTTAIWSVAVALCGAASSFVQLMLIRVAVAVGEAGCIPPAHSLIGDYFSREERPRALSIYMLGVPLALMVGFVSAGWLNQIYGWRMTFVILGLPGLVLAALAGMVLKEPRLVKSAVATLTCTDRASPAPPASATAPGAEASFLEVCRALWSNRAFRHLLLCFSVWYFFGYGLLQWTPAFFIRSHHLGTGELGLWFALVYGGGGGLGTYLGGVLANRFAAGNERVQLISCAVAFLLFGAFMDCAFLANDYRLALLALALASLGGSMALGPILATIQTLVPARMRATSVALVYLFANLIGMGLGPLAAGALSDAFRPIFGQESLRYALAVLCPGYAWAAWHLWRASQTVASDLKNAQVKENRVANAQGMVVADQRP